MSGEQSQGGQLQLEVFHLVGAAAGQDGDGDGVPAPRCCVIRAGHQRVHHGGTGKAGVDAGAAQLPGEDVVAIEHQAGAAAQQPALEDRIRVAVAGLVDVEIDAGTVAAEPAHDDAEHVADD